MSYPSILSMTVWYFDDLHWCCSNLIYIRTGFFSLLKEELKNKNCSQWKIFHQVFDLPTCSTGSALLQHHMVCLSDWLKLACDVIDGSSNLLPSIFERTCPFPVPKFLDGSVSTQLRETVLSFDPKLKLWGQRRTSLCGTH